MSRVAAARLWTGGINSSSRYQVSISVLMATLPAQQELKVVGGLVELPEFAAESCTPV